MPGAKPKTLNSREVLAGQFAAQYFQHSATYDRINIKKEAYLWADFMLDTRDIEWDDFVAERTKSD